MSDGYYFIYYNKKFWEEIIAYFTFDVILVSNIPVETKLYYACAVEQCNLEGCSVGITDGTDLCSKP
jgi:hypothetical protein